MDALRPLQPSKLRASGKHVLRPQWINIQARVAPRPRDDDDDDDNDDNGENSALSANCSHVQIPPRRKGILQTALDRKSARLDLSCEHLEEKRTFASPSQSSIRTTETTRVMLTENESGNCRHLAISKMQQESRLAFDQRGQERTMPSHHFSPRSGLAIFVCDWKRKNRAFAAMRLWKTCRAILRQTLAVWRTQARAQKLEKLEERLACERRLRNAFGTWKRWAHRLQRLCKKSSKRWAFFRWSDAVTRNLQQKRGVSICQRHLERQRLWNRFQQWTSFAVHSRRLLGRMATLRSTLCLFTAWRRLVSHTRRLHFLEKAWGSWCTVLRVDQFRRFMKMWAVFVRIRFAQKHSLLEWGFKGFAHHAYVQRKIRAVMKGVSTKRELCDAFSRWTNCARTSQLEPALKHWRHACLATQLSAFVDLYARVKRFDNQVQWRRQVNAFRAMKLYAGARRRHRSRKARKWYKRNVTVRYLRTWRLGSMLQRFWCRWHESVVANQMRDFFAQWKRRAKLERTIATRHLRVSFKVLQSNVLQNCLQLHFDAWRHSAHSSLRKRRFREAALRFRLDQKRVSHTLKAWARYCKVAVAFRCWQHSFRRNRAILRWTLVMKKCHSKVMLRRFVHWTAVVTKAKENMTILCYAFDEWGKATRQAKESLRLLRKETRRQKRRVCSELHATFRRSRGARLHYITRLLCRCLRAWSLLTRKNGIYLEEPLMQIVSQYTTNKSGASLRDLFMFARDFDLLRDDAVRRVMNRCSVEDVVDYVETKTKTTVGVQGFMILLDHFLQDIPRAMWAQEVISQARRRFAASGSIFPPSSCPDEIMTDLQLLRVVWGHREIIMQLAEKLSVSRLPSEDMDQTIKFEQEVQGLVALAAALQLPCEADIVRDLYIRSCTAPGLQIYSLIEWLVRVCKLCAPASEVASTFDEVLRRKPTAT